MKALESFPELDSAGNFEQLYLKASQNWTLLVILSSFI